MIFGKKMAALAIVAAGMTCTTVFAQSNVTVYGLLDAAIEYSKQGGGGLTRMQPGSYQGNRIGFRGTEDLGGGLSALFVLENGFTLDTGTLGQSGRLFGRQAFVGLRSELGTLSLGRQYSPYYISVLQQDAFQWTMVGGIPAITRTTVATNGSATTNLLLTGYQNIGRVDNSIVYATPKLGGFSGNLMYALGEVAGQASAGRTLGGSARFAEGNIDLNVGYTSQRDQFDRGQLKAVNAGGSYIFGPVALFAGYIRESNNTASSATAAQADARYDLYNVGLRYRATPALTLIGQAVRIRDKSTRVHPDRDANVLAIGGEYTLSKRTLVFSSIGTVDNQNGSNYSLGSGTALGGPVSGNERAKTVNIGIKHIF